MDESWASTSDPSEGDSHDGMPIRDHNGGEPIPDLARIPRAAWRAALRPLHPATRQLALSTVRSVEDAREARNLVGELLLADAPPPYARIARGPRLPVGDPPPRGTSRQVNFRLGPGEHAQLVEAAELFALRPAALARLLTVRGVERVMYEERRDR